MAKDKQKKLDNTPPTGIKVIIREFMKDKLAFGSLILVTILLLVIFIGAMLIDKDKVMTVSLLDQYSRPGEKYILGADLGGRPILEQLIIGARNSVLIGFTITIITSIIGVSFGLIAGYYGGLIDNIMMRVVDFFLILPTQMIIIVVVVLTPNYNVWVFIAAMSAFYWMGKARLFRSKTLSEGKKDYVGASKTLGTPAFKIMFREIMPNLSSLIIVNLTINFAANIGIETGMSFLGFGLPSDVPSLGTLVSYATSPDVLSDKIWVWLPASIFILVMTLSINYVGQALKRAADAKQRLG